MFRLLVASFFMIEESISQDLKKRDFYWTYYLPIQYLKVLVFTIVVEDWATNSHQNGLNINKYKTNIDKIFKICLLSNIILLNCF